MHEPWDDWIPGVLNRDQMRDLCESNAFSLNAPLDSRVIDESSIDLHLTDEAFLMRRGSVKPSHEDPYRVFLDRADLAEKLTIQPGQPIRLDAKNTYVFKLREKLGKRIGELGIHGQATAKSSVGRVDVLARLIVDGMDTYESFAPSCFTRGEGDMYLEITPITFAVLVKPGISLSQLRLFYGRPEDVEIKGAELFRAVYAEPTSHNGSLTVDVTNTKIGGVPAAAFCAESLKAPDNRPPVALWVSESQKGKKSKKASPARGSANPITYWKLKPAEKDGRFKIESENFYILRSKERICVPPGIAVYCRASDETIGEMRIHYAGFVHPLFGRRRRDKTKGTPLIFEVRGHQVHVCLADGERMANLTFYRMSKDAPIGKSKPAPYENQILELSKFFADWPKKLKHPKGVNDGTVEPA
jgi:dCTP deaminase